MVQNIKKGIPLSELTAITMTAKNKTDFYWQDDHEFRFREVMYDVVKSEKVNEETTIFYCITDHVEMKLLAKMEKQKNKNSNDDKNSPQKETNKLFFKTEFLQHENHIIVDSKTSLYNFQANFYNSLALDISSPPPNII